MSNKKNPPTGSTRKQMTEEEKQWLENFNKISGDVTDEETGEIKKIRQMDLKALAKIVPDPKIVTEVSRKVVAEDNAKRRDIYNNMKPLHALHEDEDGNEVPHDLGLEYVIYGKTDNQEIEDLTLNPAYPAREREQRYTDYDYNPPSFPDEDALIAAIDHDRAQAEKQKVKSFDEFVNQSRRRKKYDPAS
jgi:hypothetical protein